MDPLVANLLKWKLSLTESMKHWTNKYFIRILCYKSFSVLVRTQRIQNHEFPGSNKGLLFAS
jgi:hypothetical protein